MHVSYVLHVMRASAACKNNSVCLHHKFKGSKLHQKNKKKKEREKINYNNIDCNIWMLDTLFFNLYLHARCMSYICVYVQQTMHVHVHRETAEPQLDECEWQMKFPKCDLLTVAFRFAWQKYKIKRKHWTCSSGVNWHCKIRNIECQRLLAVAQQTRATTNKTLGFAIS